MAFLPLTLGVGPSSGTGGGSALKPSAKSDAEKIFKRDDFTCRFCGFRSTQYQRIVTADEGAVTACTFCEQVTMLERAGLLGGGSLVWLPEITQAELHHIARAIYVAQADDDSSLVDAATRALEAIMMRKSEAKKRLGTDEPLLLATILHENLDAKEQATAVKKLEGVRLMPLNKYMVNSKNGAVNIFPQMIKFWRSSEGPFGQLPPASWQSLLSKFAA